MCLMNWKIIKQKPSNITANQPQLKLKEITDSEQLKELEALNKSKKIQCFIYV